MRLIFFVGFLSGCAYVVGPCSIEPTTAVCEKGGRMIIIPAPNVRPAPSDGEGIIHRDTV